MQLEIVNENSNSRERTEECEALIPDRSHDQNSTDRIQCVTIVYFACTNVWGEIFICLNIEL